MTFFRFSLIPLFLTLLTLFLAPAAFAAPEFTRMPPARVMLGGEEVTDPTRIVDPSGMAVDWATGKVFVSDAPRNRVLRFADYRTLAAGAEAEAVFGQADFTTFTAGASAQSMFFPGGLWVDEAGRLWVADSQNHRVLRFDNASSLASGEAANGVLGQPGFGSASAGLSAAAMNFPVAVTMDEAGRLWVADSQNHRVLRFDNAAVKPNGVGANAVLGQPDFTTAEAPAPPSATSINRPYGLFAEPGGRLWVTDTSNHRVLRFDNAAALANGAAAAGVVGQAGFTSAIPSAAAAGLNFPASVGLDRYGRLWIGDSGNLRLVRFDDSLTLPPGATASGLLGQKDWGMSEDGGPEVHPRSLAFFHAEDDSLWVADLLNTPEFQGRVLRYAPLRVLRVTCGVDAQGRFYLEFPSQPQGKYLIETGVNLQEWSALETVTAAGAETVWTHAQNPSGRRFFRVVEQ